MAAERPILIVDDDATFNQMLKAHLEFDGEFVATSVCTLMDAAAELSSHEARFDAVILDSQLPDGNGPDFCARLRELGKKMPILLVTGFDSEGEVVRGLDAGANDYIIKPFSVSEFQARLRAQLRTFENSEHAVFSIGPYDFRPSTKMLQVRKDRRRIRLTEKESAILKYLYRASGETVARPELLNEVWGYNATVTTHTLETHIYRLRQKMEYDPTDARILITERGGYRLDPNPHLPGKFVI